MIDWIFVLVALHGASATVDKVPLESESMCAAYAEGALSRPEIRAADIQIAQCISARTGRHIDFRAPPVAKPEAKWILVFLYQGLLTTSGTTMSLDECLLRMSVNSAPQAFCAHAELPLCKVYKDREFRRKGADWCMSRLGRVQ